MVTTEVVLERGREALVALRLQGAMRPGWCGNLAAGLATRSIDIVSGHGVAIGPGVWQAKFELRCPDGPPPGPEELLSLIERDARAGFTTEMALLGYRLESSGLHGGSLELAVEAVDRTGFLAALLRRLAYYSLFPVELQLQTVDERVRDRLWLQAAGSAPPPRVRDALAEGLRAAVREPARCRGDSGP